MLKNAPCSRMLHSLTLKIQEKSQEACIYEQGASDSAQSTERWKQDMRHKEDLSLMEEDQIRNVKTNWTQRSSVLNSQLVFQP